MSLKFTSSEPTGIRSQRCPIQVNSVASPAIVDSPNISPANAANALLNFTFPKPTGIRSLPLVKPHETDLKCIPLCYEHFSTKGVAMAFNINLYTLNDVGFEQKTNRWPTLAVYLQIELL